MKRDLDRTSAEQGRDSDGEDFSKIAQKLRVKPGEAEALGLPAPPVARARGG
jgi:hypothetical protein